MHLGFLSLCLHFPNCTTEGDSAQDERLKVLDFCLQLETSIVEDLCTELGESIMCNRELDTEIFREFCPLLDIGTQVFVAVDSSQWLVKKGRLKVQLMPHFHPLPFCPQTAWTS